MPDLFLTKELTTGDVMAEIYIQRMIDGKQKYCLVHTDTFKDSKNVPLIDFADMDRDSMVDMIFMQGNTIYTFYNKYEGNAATETNLCKSAYETSHYKDNLIFA